MTLTTGHSSFFSWPPIIWAIGLFKTSPAADQVISSIGNGRENSRSPKMGVALT